MIKSCLSALLVLLCLSATLAQDKNLEKKLEKAQRKIESGKLEKAESILKDLLEDYAYSGEAWDMLTGIKMNQYYQLKNEDDGKALTVVTTTPEGDTIENDSLTQLFTKLLNQAQPSATAYEEFITTTRLALINSNTAYMTSVHQRNHLVDEDPDTAIPAEAYNFYQQAEQEFARKNFNAAAELYQKAIDEHPAYYKASLYLGDAYYYLEYYDEAIIKFKEAIQKFPNKLEPRKYLTDAYLHAGVYDLALDEAINAYMIYPDLIMMSKIQYLLKQNGKPYYMEWTARPTFPNKIPDKSDLFFIQEELPKELPEHWMIYSNSLDKVADQCSPEGIISLSEETEQRYLEVYSWEQMLAQSVDPSLEVARKMQKAGYLDCYVMLTCFHIDFYEQYKDFVANNPEKVREYFNTQFY